MIVRPKVELYAELHTSGEPPWLGELAAETRDLTVLPQMMVGPLEGQFLQALVYAMRPRSVLEIGTFTGYSALSMAAQLPPGGRIVTCELDPRHADIAARHFAASPWADRITLLRGPAQRSLEDLDGPFDLVFIDADKDGYAGYFDAVLPKLADHGLMVVDNVLQFGGVANEHDQTPDIVALRAFNTKVAVDDRVEQVVLTVREGVTLIRRRG
jgi:caffeoyl-CoA O-methyltransferase